MKSKTTRHGLKRMTALLLAVVLCVGMVPTAFAAQQDSYHDPAENWQEANNRTNELDANATVTHETFNCKVCKQQTSFIVFRTPEYTRDGQTAMSRNVKYSDGTFVDGSGKGPFWTAYRDRTPITRLITGPKPCVKPAAASTPTWPRRTTAT